MKLCLPFLYVALLSVGIMPIAVAQPESFLDRANPNSEAAEHPQISAQLLTQEPASIPADDSAVVEVQGVRLNRTPNGLELILETTAGQRLKVSTSSQGNTLIADIPNTQLRLPQGNEFRANNPAEEIATVSVTNLNANNIRVTVTGKAGVPKVEVFESEQEGLIFSLTPAFQTGKVPPAPAQQTPVAKPEAKPGEEPQTPEGEEQPPAQAQEEEEIEVVVTATRTEQDVLNVPRTVTVITREEIEQQSKLTPNLFDILGYTVPGFGPPNQSDRNNAQLLRGREPLILIDGVPQNSNFFGGLGLRGFDPSIVERIEVVSGPTGIYGSGAAGGVINIITRGPSEEKLTSRAELGVAADLGNLQGDSFAYNLGYGISGTEGSFDYLINLGTQFTNQFYDAEGDLIPQDNPTLAGATIFNVLGKLGVALDDQQRLQLTVNHASDRRDADYVTDPIVRDIPGRQKARALEVNQEYINLDEPGTITTSINLNYTHENLWGSQVQAQAYYWNNEVRQFPFDDRGGFYDAITVFSPFTAEAFGGRFQVETPLFQTAKLLWGSDYRNEQNELILEVIDPVEFDSSGQRIVRSIEERNLLPPYRISQLGLFAQLQWDLSDRFILNGGIRQEFVELSVDDYTTFFGDEVEGGDPSFDATVFNIGTVYKLTDDLSFFASFSQGFSVPLLFSLATVPLGTSVEQGFRALEPQKVDNYEIGVRGRWQNLQASLSGFYNYSELGTFFQLNPGSRVGELTRAPQRNYGIEATLDWQPGGSWQLGGAFSWTEGEANADDDGEFLALSSFDVQPLKLTAYVEHQTTPDWSNRLQFLYSGSRDRAFEDGTDGLEIEDYFTVDFISRIRLGDGALSLAVENLLDNQYFPVYAQALSGFDDATYRAARGRRLSLTYSISW